MSGITNHLVILPILLPLVVAAVMLLIADRFHWLRAVLGIASAVTLLIIAITLLIQVDADPASSALRSVYLLGNWPTPFGIVLVVDHLATLMLTLTSVLAIASLVYSLARWHRVGTHFHPLVQFLLVGLNGAFLTGDLFNLFVFFEVMLAASYGLLLHGAGTTRIQAGLHYIAINLAASLLFLIGVALIYGAANTLNMADLAARIPELAGADRRLLEAGAAILGIAFLVKAAMWPLSFWLPPAYAAASPPAAALFAITSKVGIYALLRLWLLLFGNEADASSQFGATWLLYGGIATVLFGAIGSLASQNMARLAGYSVLISSGTLLAAMGTGQVAVVGAGLFYLVASTLGISAFYLLIELAERGQVAGADVLAVTQEVFGEPEDEEELEEDSVGVAIPATMALLGISFGLCALSIAGLPPVAGFVAKFAILSAAFNPEGLGAGGTVSPTAWVLLTVLLLSGLAGLIALVRAGIRTFWAPLSREVPRVRIIEMLPVGVLLLLSLVMTAQAGTVLQYTQAAAESLFAPETYIQYVLTEPTVGSNPSGEEAQ